MYAPRSRSYCTAFNKAAAGHTLLISVKFKALKCDIRKKAEKPCAITYRESIIFHCVKID